MLRDVLPSSSRPSVSSWTRLCSYSGSVWTWENVASPAEDACGGGGPGTFLPGRGSRDELGDRLGQHLEKVVDRLVGRGVEGSPSAPGCPGGSLVARLSAWSGKWHGPPGSTSGHSWRTLKSEQVGSGHTSSRLDNSSESTRLSGSACACQVPLLGQVLF